MKPYPFASLNHFTVPVAIKTPPPAKERTGRGGAPCATDTRSDREHGSTLAGPSPREPREDLQQGRPPAAPAPCPFVVPPRRRRRQPPSWGTVTVVAQVLSLPAPSRAT